MKKSINNKSFSNFKFNMYTKLMENYNIDGKTNASLGSGNITEVCASVDSMDREVTIAALSDGSIYQFYPDMTGDTDFLSGKLNISGEKLAIGLCANNIVYLFAVRDNKLYYTRETDSDRNIFENETEAQIDNVIDGRTIEKVIVRGLDDGLAVGLVLKNSRNTYEFAVTYFKDGFGDFQIVFYNQQTDKFIFTGNDYNSLNIVTAASRYIKFNVSDQTADIYKNHDDRIILDLQWAGWSDGTDIVFVLLAGQNTGSAVLAVVEENAANQEVRFNEVLSQDGLEAFLLTSYHAKRKEELHLLALGNKCLYHTLAVKGKDGSINYNTFMPIAGNVTDASFTSDTTGKVTIYISKENERNVIQRRYNRYTGEYMESIMYLPQLAADGDTVRKKSCYSTEIRITDLNDVPLANQPVTIWSREATYLMTVNGTYSINKNIQTNLMTDFKGSITLKQQVDTLNANILFIRFDNLMEEGQNIAIDQMEVIYQKLKKVSTDELINAKTATGYLLPDNLRKDSSKVDNTILKPLKAAADMVTNPTNYGSVVGAYILSDSELEEEYFSESDDVNLLSSWRLGDLFWGTRESVVPIYDVYIAKDGSLQTSYTINGQTIIQKIITKTINEFFNCVEMLFNKIKVAFKDLFEWLGFLFKWDDILRSKKAVKYFFNRQLIYYKSQSSKWSEDLCSDIDDIKLQAHTLMTGFADIIGGKSLFGYYNENKIQNIALDDSMSNNFVQDKLFSKLSVIKFLNSDMSLVSIQEDDADDLLEKLQKYVNGMKDNGDLQNELKSLKNSYLNADSLFTNLFSDFIKGLDIVVQLVLTGIKELVAAAFSLMNSIIDAFSNLVSYEIYIPYISDLYRSISGGDSLTILDVFALLIAIPLTASYKVIMKTAPFDSEAKLNDYCNELDKMLSGNGEALIRSTPAGYILINKSIGTLSGAYFYMMNALIDCNNFQFESERKFLDINSLISELLFAASVLPPLNGLVGLNSWLLFSWSLVGFLIDTYYYIKKKIYIDREDFGAYATCIYGAIHVVLAGYVVIDECETVKWYDIVGNIAPCFAEIFKFCTTGEFPMNGMTVLFDSVAALTVLVTGYASIIDSIISDESNDLVTI